MDRATRRAQSGLGARVAERTPEAKPAVLFAGGAMRGQIPFIELFIEQSHSEKLMRSAELHSIHGRKCMLQPRPDLPMS